MEDQVTSFKEHLAGENFFQPSGAGQDLSIEETGRVAGSLFAHDSFNHFKNQISNYPQLSEELRGISSHPDFALPSGATDNPVGFGHNEIDSRYSGSLFSDPSREVNIDALSPIPQQLGIHSFQLKKLGDDASLIDLCENIDQFLSGVFIAIIKADQSNLNGLNVCVGTEDEPFRSLELDGVLIEIRTFDTSYFEIYSENQILMKELAELYDANIEKFEMQADEET